MIIDECALQQVRERRLLINRLDAWIFRQLETFTGQRVLEIGCGVGNMAPYLRGRAEVFGIDVSEEAVAAYRSAGFPARVCDATSEGVLDLGRFDTVLSVNVLEHIEDDRKCLDRCYTVLEPGGTIILVVPAHQFLYGTMDRPIGHWRRYGVRDLSQKLTEAGFEVVQARTINPLGALGWYVNGRILRRNVPPVGQLRLFNAMYPLMVAADRLRLPFGLSVLAVGRKPR